MNVKRYFTGLLFVAPETHSGGLITNVNKLKMIAIGEKLY